MKGARLLAVALVLAPSAALADPPRARVTLAVGRPEALRVALAELLGRLGVGVDFDDAASVDVGAVLAQPPRADLVARVWVDLPSPGRARLFLVDAGGDRVLVRTLALPGGFDEVARETVAHLVEDAVDALLHGAVIGVHRDTLRAHPPSPPPPPPSPPPAVPARVRATRAWRFHVGAWGEAQLRGPMAAAGLGVSASLSLPAGAWRVGAGVAYQPRAGWGVVDGPFAVSAAEHALRVVAFARTEPRPLGVGFGLGAGADVVDASSVASRNDARALPLGAFVAPVARAEAALRVRLAPSAALAAGASLEVDLDGTVYAARQGAGAVPVLAPWPARPGLTLGVEGSW